MWRRVVAVMCVGVAMGADPVAIDGINTTIGLALTGYFAGDTAETFTSVSGRVTGALNSPSEEEDMDYFALIKEDVQKMVGTFINEQNIQQLEQYKDDLANLLDRYAHAPADSSSYADKNTMANSLSTSIISNRFLIEAVEWPHSMMLHYADIASIHISVLHDAAQTYTSDPEQPSYWWVDLDRQLDHYITYGRALENTFVDWRNDRMDCSYSECVKSLTRKTCYDVWTVTDKVAELTDSCRAVHGSDTCDDHCQAYQISMNKEVTVFAYYYLGQAVDQWEALKETSSEMAANARTTRK